jgi:hypothetical protein
VMLHQWHPRKYAVLARRGEIAQAKKTWRYNHELVKSRVNMLKRNPNGWGGVAEAVVREQRRDEGEVSGNCA